ncbi:MAG: SAM-dependent methyltransferase [Bauldia sp.]|nr:SAM-dependent methyltransferase [Bauldia sp.]
MSVADYMAACLGDPEHGYYRHRDPFGAAGDFVTAPEVSQMFGELIGLWCVAVWEAMGSPPRLVLAELGPGRGTLMADALRAAALRPAFREGATVALVETSPRLRDAQRAALAKLGVLPRWVDRVEDLPDGPLLVIANEFFDALPIHQYVRTPEGWAERMVGLDADGKLAFGLRPMGDLPPSPGGGGSSRARQRSARGGVTHGAAVSHHPGRPTPADPPPPGEGEVLELRPAADAIVAHLAGRIARDGGAALIVDYGHAETAFGDTLQAVRGHRYDDPLAHPGEADLTAHVDFAAHARAAAAAGAGPTAVATQGAFLETIGIAHRAAALARGKGAAEAEAIGAALRRLTHPDEMGTLFKVLGIAAPGLPLPGLPSASS